MSSSPRTSAVPLIRKDEEGRPPGELRARRTGERTRSGAGAQARPGRGGGARCFQPGTSEELAAQTMENVILTPHIGGSTHEAQEAVGVQIAQQVREYLKHGVIQNAVNVPSVSAEEYAEMQPYIVLAERMGAFLAQISEGSIEEISLRYSGHIAEWKTELIRNAAIKGILNQTLEEKANLVNAAS